MPDYPSGGGGGGAGGTFTSIGVNDTAPSSAGQIAVAISADGLTGLRVKAPSSFTAGAYLDLQNNAGTSQWKVDFGGNTYFVTGKSLGISADSRFTFTAANGAVNAVLLSAASNLQTSGTAVSLKVATTFAPTATSTMIAVPLYVNPTINYSNGTPGAGNYEAIKIDVVETALPTGTNYLLRARNGAAGTTDVFNITRTGLHNTTLTGIFYVVGFGGNTGSLSWTPASSSKTITIPNITGTLITTADSGTVTISMLASTTGLTSAAVGDIIYANATTPTWTRLASVAAGSYLRSGGVSTAPVWSTITLPNSVTTGDLLMATASNVVGVRAAVATGQVLISQGTSTAPVWSNKISLVGTSTWSARFNTWSEINGGPAGVASVGMNGYVSATDNVMYASNTHASLGALWIFMNPGAGGSMFAFNYHSGATTADSALTAIPLVGIGYVSSTPRMGVATASPLWTLHVGPGADTPFQNSVSAVGVYITNNGDTNFALRDSTNNIDGGMFTFNSSSAIYFGVWTNHVLIVRINNADVARFDLTGSFQLGGNAARAGTAGTNRLDIFNGTAPTSTLANGISLYVTSGELRVMDAGGTATLLSPHDDEGFWIYDSSCPITGKRLLIHMEKFVRAVSERLGLNFIEEFALEGVE